MNKTIKTLLIIAGLALLGYGIYTMIIPETDINIGELDLIESQDNTNAYITIGLGILALAVALLGRRK